MRNGEWRVRNEEFGMKFALEWQSTSNFNLTPCNLNTVYSLLRTQFAFPIPHSTYSQLLYPLVTCSLASASFRLTSTVTVAEDFSVSQITTLLNRRS